MDALANAPRLLIVEDDADIREGLAELLRDSGYAVAVAANGEEGLAAARSHRPDAVILDLMMPVMDGFAFLEHRAADATIAGVPVIVLTARTAVHLAGCEIVQKPFDLEGLLRRVARLVSRRGDSAPGASA